MANEATSLGRIRGHRLTIETEFWPLPDCDVVVTVRKAYATRSIQQNRRYWGRLVKAASAYTGHTLDQTHEIFKAKFLQMIVEVPGEESGTYEEFRLGGTTRELDTEQFGRYCDEIEAWITSWDPPCVLPPE